VKSPEREEEPSPIPDLMAALEQSLAEVKGRGQAAAPRR
jgi:hypothetical protein